MRPPPPVPFPRLVLALLACGLLGSGPSAESLLANQPKELAERLEKNGVVMLEEVGRSDSASFILALVRFEQPSDRVRELLRLAERQPEYREELSSVRTVSQLPNGRIDEQRIKILFIELVYRVEYHEDPESGRITWALDEDFDNEIARMDGFWEFYASENDSGVTLGRFGSNVDIGKGVPKFVQKRSSRKTVLRYVRNLRQWIDSDGEWRH